MKQSTLMLLLLLATIPVANAANPQLRRAYPATVTGSVLYELAQFWVRAPDGQVYRVKYNEAESSAQESALFGLVGRNVSLRGRLEELRSGTKQINVERRLELIVP